MRNNKAKIEIRFSLFERDLILNHIIATDEKLTTPLKMAEIDYEDNVLTRYTRDDLQELLGYVATEVEHVTDEQRGAMFDKLFERLILV